ncbi:TPA: hypothetical protein ACH3X2_009141 [Trebouxia sp. C0005]
MVDAWGLPSFFYADCRRAFSLEMDGDQCHGAAAEVVCNGCVLQDASIECSAHFRKRIQRHYTALNYKGVWYSSIILIDSRSAMDDACTMATTNEAASQASHNGEQKATDGGQKLLRRLKRP